MTNKKLKLAAMSVALTACVAAQPMAAHAVEGPDSVEDNAAPQAEPAPVEGKTAEGEVEGEEEKQEEFVPPVNDEAKKDDQAPAFGPGTKTDDIIIDYKPAEKPEEPGKSGEDGETDSSEGSGETDETENPDGTYVKGDVIDNSKKDEATGKDGKIGEATKEETPDSSSSTTVVDPDAEVKKGDPVVGKDEDGNPTITTPTETTGTQTTTTTGTGKADSSTTIITDTKKGEEIDLNKELKNKDGKVKKPTWETKAEDKLGDYTVKEVKATEGDPNSKTLTLKKTSDPETKEMSAEDVAKLLDVPKDGVEKKTDDEGKTTYILKKEETSTDENGNTVTRVTYYKITDNTVETTTETTLVLKVEKGTVDVDNEDLTTEIKLPSITAKNTDETKTDVIEISSEKLGKMLDDKNYNKDTGEYVYTETVDGKEYTYKVKKTENTKPLTPAQLAERLGEGFTGDDNGVYYKGEKLTFDQMEAVRKTLSYTVEVTEVTKTPGQVEGGQESIESAKETAKLEAIKAALTDAARNAGINVETDDFKNQLNTIDPTGKGQLNLSYTDADGNVHTVTLRYDGATVSAPQPGTPDSSKDTETRKDVTDNVITGTAYVTGSNTWTESGSLNGTYVKPGSGELPSLDGWTIASKDPEKGTTTYKKEDTVTSPDGTSTKITRTCTITESSASLSDTEKEEIAWAELLNQHPEYKNKDELKAAGYNINISSMDFSGIKRVEWTIDELSESTKTDAKDLNDKLVIPGGKNWSIDEKARTITVDGKTYDKVTKTNDGYTCTVEDKNGVKTTYTFTKQAGAPLTPEEIQTALAGQYSVPADSIRLNADGKTATFTKGDETITVDYSTLSETLTVRKDVHTSSSVTDIIKDNKDLEKAYDELWKQIQEIQSKLLPGEELWIGNLEVTDKTEKTDIIKYFTTAISPENMSKDELIKALQEQERIAKNSTYVANKGSDYEETKKNYYSGEKTNEFKSFSKAPDGSKIEVYWKWTLWGGYYYYTDANGQEVRVHSNTVHYEEQRDDIGHLDLASGSKLDLLPDKDDKVDQTDCVLVSKNLKLEWNYDAGNLVNGKGNQPVGLDSKISWDDEGGEGDGHYEYDRGNPNNCPDKSAYYKLTGTVAYDPIKENGSIKLYQGQRGDYWTPGISAEDQAINAYLKATGSSKTAASLTKKERDAIVGTYVVKIGTTGTNSTGESGYQVYLKTSELTAYGYMTRDANTCINSTYKRQDGTWGYVGGYDLMISKLTQVSEGKVVGQTESTIKTITAPLSIRSSQDFANRLLELNQQTTTHKTSERATAYGENTSGGFDGAYTQDKSETVTGSGTGKGHYTTFTEVLKKLFTGSGSKEHDEGKVSYTHRTTDKVNTTPVSKETETTTNAHVGYNYTSIETRTVTVNGEETVIVPPVTPPVDPDTPDGPVEDETPDEVVTPETPELPPVQDATPDEVVLPAEPELPAVQDATALPQTGVNWMAALGMAFSGMLLTIAGAFASLKYKEKH
jgi:hypothetical protein